MLFSEVGVHGSQFVIGRVAKAGGFLQMAVEQVVVKGALLEVLLRG